MDRNELIEELTEDILTYVMHGEFPKTRIGKNLKPTELDKRFEDYDKLLDLHFILKEKVINFVKELPKKLRRIKTQTKRTTNTYHGTVQGNINWDETIQTRYTQNPQDNTLFICENRTENYNIDENIVLKKILSIIYQTLQDVEKYLKKDYEWVTQGWKNNKNLIDEMKTIFEKNVHITRIKEPKTYEPTQRMIHKAKNSRQQIYRQAANLIQTRKSIKKGNPKEIKELIQKTAITPDDTETLFELYVLFKLITTIEDIKNQKFKLKTIEKEKQEIATMKTDPKITIYHDNSAKDRNLNFQYQTNKKPNKQNRLEQIQTTTTKIMNNYFKQTKTKKHTGRPDVIVLEMKNEKQNEYQYLITEVKYTTNKKTIQKGIKETLEYLAFLNINNNYVFKNKNTEPYFGNGYNGLLIIRDLEQQTENIENQNTIKILQASETNKNLKKILKKILKK